MNLEKSNYIATAGDIEALATKIFDSEASMLGGRQTYLSALVGTTQNALDSAPRKRAGKPSLLDDLEVERHLKAFETVAGAFYAAVQRAALKRGGSKAEQRSMTGFARSAASTLRSYIRSKQDIRTLAAGKVTKAALAVVTKPRKPTGPIIKGRVQRLQDEMTKAAESLMAVDPQEAKDTFRGVIAEISKVLGLTDRPTKDAAVAVAQDRPLKVEGTVFMPMQPAAQH